MQRDDLRGLAQPLLDVAAADKLGDRVDEGHMARPAGAGGDDVCAALGDVVDDLGVVIDVGVGREMHIFHRHAQLRIDLLVQILDHGVNKAGFVGDGGDVALIVRPFVLGKDILSFSICNMPTKDLRINGRWFAALLVQIKHISRYI